MDKLFVSGMFRSGTTLLARLLNVHPYINMASDPFAPLFKEYRNEIANGHLKLNLDPESPLDSYDLLEDLKLFRSIQNANFKISIRNTSTNSIRDKINKHCAPYTPKLLPYIPILEGITYSDVLELGYEILNKITGTDSTKITGIKEVWTNEFVPHFLSLNACNKVILIIRDPRGIVASNFSTNNHRYPFTFLCRQWRKLTELANSYSQIFDRVLILRYEDLIMSPFDSITEICDFLNVDYHPNMMNPALFTDGFGNRWFQNTSYDESINRFNENTINKWRMVLTQEQTDFIEAICHDQMLSFDYIRNVKPKDKYIDSILNFKEIESGIANWIKPYVNNDNRGEIDRLKTNQKNTLYNLTQKIEYFN